MSQFANPEKFIPSLSSSSFVIWLVNYYFEVSFNILIQNNSNYREWFATNCLLIATHVARACFFPSSHAHLFFATLFSSAEQKCHWNYDENRQPKPKGNGSVVDFCKSAIFHFLFSIFILTCNSKLTNYRGNLCFCMHRERKRVSGKLACKKGRTESGWPRLQGPRRNWVKSLESLSTSCRKTRTALQRLFG